MAEKMDDQPPLEDTVEKMDDQPPLGAMTEKMDDQPPLGGMAEKMDDQPLQPVPSPRDTTSHPQEGGGAVAVRRVVGGQGAEAVQPVYHSPSLEDKEMLQTSVEESLMPSPATSQMVVTVKRE